MPMACANAVTSLGSSASSAYLQRLLQSARARQVTCIGFHGALTSVGARPDLVLMYRRVPGPLQDIQGLQLVACTSDAAREGP